MNDLLLKTMSLITRMQTHAELGQLDDHMRRDIGLPPVARMRPERLWRVFP
jgi:uncharacterized protein YjiS (DUF1127 family)